MLKYFNILIKFCKSIVCEKKLEKRLKIIVVMFCRSQKKLYLCIAFEK